MRNCPVWHTLEEMSQSFDSLEKNTKAMGIMKELQLVNENDCTGEYEYSESRFSKLYKEHLWMDNMMRSSFLYTLDRLLEMRGFQVTRPVIGPREDYDWEPIEDLVKQEKEERDGKTKKNKPVALKGVGKAYDRNNNPGMIADVIGDVYGEEDDYGEEGAKFQRENESNYDFM
jgi:hypothetical protein